MRNTGSAPFYPDWPVAVALLDSTTKKPVWSAPLADVDIRKWLPGEDWDSADLLKQLTQQWRDGWRKALPPEKLN